MAAHSETHGHGHDHGHGGAHSHGTMSQLMIGLGMAVVLTLVPFVLVMSEIDIDRTLLVGIIMGLGAVQILVHLVYFLHVNAKAEQGWTLAATVFSVVILGIVLAGSLWVMHNMNVNMMPGMMHDNSGEMIGISPERGAPVTAPAGAAPVDHSNMPGMDHSNMPGMTHSTQP